MSAPVVEYPKPRSKRVIEWPSWVVADGPRPTGDCPCVRRVIEWP